MMAKVSFDQSLERCLQKIVRTGDIEASLRRYPQYADRLHPLLEMAQATRRHYEAVPEAPGGLAVGRERLLAVAAQQRARIVAATPAAGTATTRIKGRRMKLVFATRLVTVLLAVVVGTAVLGGGIVWAAGDSLPGDLLYPVKLVTEDVRLALAPAPADQVDLALWLTEERAEEVQALVAAGRPVPDETVVRMEQHVERALTQAAWASDEKEMAGLLTCIAERTRTQAQVLEQAQAMASRQAQAGLERAVTACQRGAEAAEDGLNDPQMFRQMFRHRKPVGTPPTAPHSPLATPRRPHSPLATPRRPHSPLATPRRPHSPL
ncbi:MAG: DUF5667 domain-containing protein, partial [Anaerolineae bacterium]